MIKCIGCLKLQRVRMKRPSGNTEVYYDCPGVFPYMATIGGLLRPGKGITEAAEGCTVSLEGHCILCAMTVGIGYGTSPNVFVCFEHDKAWGKWLTEHSERRAYLKPLGRLRTANWVEVFREFIEDMRE